MTGEPRTVMMPADVYSMLVQFDADLQRRTGEKRPIGETMRRLLLLLADTDKEAIKFVRENLEVSGDAVSG